ncbi:MAG: amidohydrolase family protein [Desulfobacteraceae bacterium]|nr:MAG: amidohydrolase family protein [Desulfobacteraceae bacterium]
MIIDFHTHVFPSFFRDERKAFFPDEPTFETLYLSPKAKLVSAKELLRSMDEDEVHKSVIFGFPWENPDNYRRHNDYVIESVNQYPDRFIGFCCFSPLAAGGPREAERCLNAGLSGVGELAVYGTGLSADIVDALKEVMELCSQFDVTLLLHANEPVGHDYAGKTPMTLRQLYDFLKAYPLNRIVLAHWGGGIFFYSLMKKEVREVLQNVWFDTAASPYLYTPDIYRIAGEAIGFEKILFGSDYPLLKPQRYFKEMTAAGLSPRSVELVKGLNAEKLLSPNG